MESQWLTLLRVEIMVNPTKSGVEENLDHKNTAWTCGDGLGKSPLL